MFIACLTCGATFEKRNPRHVYCRPACRTKEIHQWVDLVCERCGKGFRKHPYDLVNKKGKQPASNGRYCGRACFHASLPGRTMPVRRPPDAKVCLVCGKSFEAGGRTNKPRDQVYCSGECRGRGTYRKSARSKSIDSHDAAYIAAFVDGEGSIILIDRGGGVGVKLQVTNSDRAILGWLADVTGVGKVHRHRDETDRRKATMQWVVNAEGVETVLEQIRPYLRIKGRQADLAIETQQRLRDPALKADRSWQMEYREQMRAMNRRGPALTCSSGG